jgi:hypothetical protein
LSTRLTSPKLASRGADAVLGNDLDLAGKSGGGMRKERCKSAISKVFDQIDDFTLAVTGIEECRFEATCFFRTHQS